jgi:starvation-inducible DNA-binding protein
LYSPLPDEFVKVLEAHETILKEACTMAQWATESGDDGTNDLLGSQLIRKDELQAWFLAQRFVDVPFVRADQSNAAASGR